MTKKSTWWRKPFRKDEENDRDNEEYEYYDKDNEYTDYDPGDYREHERSVKRRKSQRKGLYGERPEDWEYHNRRSRSPSKWLFDEDEMDSIFSRSHFGLRDDFFSDIEREFSDMHRRMDQLLRQAAEGKLQPGEGGPIVYGFSMRTGLDGVPRVQEFGNMPPEMRGRLRDIRTRSIPFTSDGELGNDTFGSNNAVNSCSTGTCGQTGIGPTESGLHRDIRKPLTDVLDCDDHVSIAVELPGVEKNDINLEIIDNELELDVESPIRKYYDKIHLPAEVDPESISASFNNGVLEVCVKRLKPKKPAGKKIDIN